MKTLIIVKSTHHQNTAKVAEVIANVLHADVRNPEDVTPELLRRYDLVGLGSGIYFGRFHFTLRQLLSRLPVLEQPSPVFLFSTAGLSLLRPLWHRPVKNRLIKLGYQIVGEFSCRGWDTVGPLCLMGGLNRKHPNEWDLTRAMQFAQQLAQTIREETPHKDEED